MRGFLAAVARGFSFVRRAARARAQHMCALRDLDATRHKGEHAPSRFRAGFPGKWRERTGWLVGRFGREPDFCGIGGEEVESLGDDQIVWGDRNDVGLRF